MSGQGNFPRDFKEICLPRAKPEALRQPDGQISGFTVKPV
jgi:hypothetical protein